MIYSKILLTTLLKEVFLDEISDKAKSQAKERFKKQDPNLTDEILDYYINIFSDKQSSNVFQEKDIMKYTFPELKKIVGDNFSRKKTNIDINDTNFEESEDVIYNQNKLLILLGDLKEKCIRYGTGKKWCISRRDTSNMFFSYRMRLNEPVFYFVFDKSKLPLDKYRAIVIYIDLKGKYTLSNANNDGDIVMTWDEIEKIQPKLKGLQDLFKHIPLTKQEKEEYKKFKKSVNNETYENFDYDEREKYIGFGHDLTEEQIRMTWDVPNQKTLISKYVTTGFGANLPKDIESKLSPSDRAKNIAARTQYIEQGRNLTDSQFNSCDNELKKKYIKKMIEKTEPISDSQFKLCNDELKKEYVEAKIKKGDFISDGQFEWCDDELKKYYIEKTLKMFEYDNDDNGDNFHKLTDKQLKYCDDKTKQEYLKLLIDTDYFELSPYEFKMLNDELKIQHIKKNVSQGFNIDDKILKSSSKKIINDYIEYCIEKSKNISDYAFQLCTSDQKIKYVINIVKTDKYILSDENFEWCPEELKKDYIEKNINFLKKRLLDGEVPVAMQVQWAKDHGLTESIKLMDLLK
jgi:hypothetical protein